MKVSKEELKELIKLYSGMDKLSRAIWLGSGSLLLGKEMTEKEQMMVQPQKTAQEVNKNANGYNMLVVGNNSGANFFDSHQKVMLLI